MVVLVVCRLVGHMSCWLRRFWCVRDLVLWAVVFAAIGLVGVCDGRFGVVGRGVC